jgi:hypothetical protein
MRGMHEYKVERNQDSEQRACSSYYHPQLVKCQRPRDWHLRTPNYTALALSPERSIRGYHILRRSSSVALQVVLIMLAIAAHSEQEDRGE